jgi:hypothetical protein
MHLDVLIKLTIRPKEEEHFIRLNQDELKTQLIGFDERYESRA